jgi:tetratricopeptide (TPR) repeat protein
MSKSSANIWDNDNNRGCECLQRGDYFGALRYFNKAIKKDKNDAVVYYNRGIACRSIGLYENAINDNTKAIELEPWNLSAYTNRGLAFYDLAEKYLDAISSIKNYSHKKYDAKKKIAMDYLKKAVDDHTQVIEKKENNIDSYISRGLAYTLLKEFDLAIKDFNTIIERDNQNVSAYNNRGIAYSKKGDIDSAINNWNTAIAIDPNNYNSYLNLGKAYRTKKDYKKSLEIYTILLELNPYIDAAQKEYEYVLNKCRTEYGSFIPERKAELYDAVVRAEQDGLSDIKKDKKNAIAHANLGTLYGQKAVYLDRLGMNRQAYVERVKAIKHLTKAIKIMPSYSSFYFSRGNIYYDIKNLNGAREDYLTTIKLDPNDIEAINYLNELEKFMAR